MQTQGNSKDVVALKALHAEQIQLVVAERAAAKARVEELTLRLGRILRDARAAGFRVREIQELCGCSYKQVYDLMNRTRRFERQSTHD